MIDFYEVRQYLEEYIIQLCWQEPGLREGLQEEGAAAFNKITQLQPLAKLPLKFHWEDSNTLIWLLPQKPSYPHTHRNFSPLPQPESHWDLSLYIQRKNWERRLQKALMADPQLEKNFLLKPKETLEQLGSPVPDHLTIQVLEADDAVIDIVMPEPIGIVESQKAAELEQASGWRISTSPLWLFHHFGANLNATTCSIAPTDRSASSKD